MFKKLTYFIKYHNAFPIALSVVLLGSGVVFAASPQAREAIISENTTVRSVDNSYIINVDLGAYNPQLKITSVEKDDSNYYVSYTYDTISIDNYVWKKYKTNETLTVSKRALGDKDLGLYVAKEISEVINNEDVYLKKVQDIEKNKGTTKKIATTEYSGLVGRMLSTKVEEFEGYVPVIPEEKPVVDTVAEGKVSEQIVKTNNISAQVAAAVPSKEEIKQIIRETVKELLAKENNTTPTTQTQTQTPPPPTTTSTTTPTTTDTQAPVITIVGNNPANIDINSSYVDLGATVTDNVNDNLGISYKVDGTTVSSINLDTSADITYTITYSATDQAGNTGTATRTVVVGTGIVATTTTQSVTTTPTTTQSTTATQDTTTSTSTTSSTTPTSTTSATDTATTTNETASTTANTSASSSTSTSSQ